MDGLVLRPLPVLLGDCRRDPVVMAVWVIFVASVFGNERVHDPFLRQPCCRDALEPFQADVLEVDVAVETTALIRPHERSDGFHDTLEFGETRLPRQLR